MPLSYQKQTQINRTKLKLPIQTDGDFHGQRAAQDNPRHLSRVTLQRFRVSSTFLPAVLHKSTHKSNGKGDYVKRMKEMAGIQWERHALHTWQAEGREAGAV